MGDESYYRRPPAPADFGFPRRFPPGPPMFGRGRGLHLQGRGAGFNGPRRLPLPPAANFLGNPPKPALPLGNPAMNNVCLLVF